LAAKLAAKRHKTGRRGLWALALVGAGRKESKRRTDGASVTFSQRKRLAIQGQYPGR